MERLELPKLGFVINSKCNLQCFGCNHFSNYSINDTLDSHPIFKKEYIHE